MGNRAVITTRENFENDGVGIYVHWNGGYASIDAFLAYCELRGYRKPEDDNYGWSALCQVICNFNTYLTEVGSSSYLADKPSVGIDILSNLDCDNHDNGVYIIENWRIVGREFFPEGKAEQKDYDLEQFMNVIDRRFAEEVRLGEDKIHAYVRRREKDAE